jgi:hypothetical protein
MNRIAPLELKPVDWTKEKPRAAEESLPAELRPVFRELVEQYRFRAFLTKGLGFVSYEVLAGLVLDGWRPNAAPVSGGAS